MITSSGSSSRRIVRVYMYLIGIDAALLCAGVVGYCAGWSVAKHVMGIAWVLAVPLWLESTRVAKDALDHEADVTQVHRLAWAGRTLVLAASIVPIGIWMATR